MIRDNETGGLRLDLSLLAGSEYSELMKSIEADADQGFDELSDLDVLALLLDLSDV